MIPVDVLRTLAIEWRREADVIAPETFELDTQDRRNRHAAAVTCRRHATELDDIANHYETKGLQ